VGGKPFELHQQKCGPGQPPEPHLHVESLVCLLTAGRRNDRFSPTALTRSAAFAEASCRSVTSRSRARNHSGGQQPCPAPLGAAREGRPQRPGNQFRARARFRNVPPALHPRKIAGCRWLCRSHSAGSGRPTFCCRLLSPSSLPAATEKPCTLVHNLWTTGLPCGIPRENPGEIVGKKKVIHHGDTETPRRTQAACHSDRSVGCPTRRLPGAKSKDGFRRVG